MHAIRETPIRHCHLTNSIDLARDIEISRREIADGKGISHTQVMPEMTALINRLAAKKNK